MDSRRPAALALEARGVGVRSPLSSPQAVGGNVKSRLERQSSENEGRRLGEEEAKDLNDDAGLHDEEQQHEAPSQTNGSARAGPEQNDEEAFEEVLREGPKLMRKGTLESIQGEVLHARRSQRDLLKEVRDTRKVSDEANFIIDNNLRKLTVAQAVVNRMLDRVSRAKEANFVQGSTEYNNWNALRSHAQNVVRKAKLQQAVEETKEQLHDLGVKY